MIVIFHAVANFPNVIGCVDCTHVKITTPPINEHHDLCCLMARILFPNYFFIFPAKLAKGLAFYFNEINTSLTTGNRYLISG